MTVIVDTSTSAAKEARTIVAAAIEAHTGYTCHASMEAALATPCYVIEPGGWKIHATGVVYYTMRVSCLYANQSGAGELSDAVEALALGAWQACTDAGVMAPEVPAPGSLQVGENRTYAGVQFDASCPVTLTS